MKRKKIIKNLILIFGPLLCGTIISFFIDTNIYNLVNKPPLSPPKVVFPIVWSILYLLMGISVYLISKSNNDKVTFSLFIKQLIINLFWPIVFFNFKWYFIAVIWLLLLIFFVIKMIQSFFNNKKIAALLQFPYLIWLFFAIYLNIGVAILN